MPAMASMASSRATANPNPWLAAATAATFPFSPKSIFSPFDWVAGPIVVVALVGVVNRLLALLIGPLDSRANF